MFDRGYPGRQNTTDIGVPEDAKQSGSMGKVERGPGWQPPLFGRQFSVHVRFLVHKGYRDAQFSQLIGSRNAGRVGTDNDHTLEPIFGTFHFSSPPISRGLFFPAFQNGQAVVVSFGEGFNVHFFSPFGY